MTRGGSNFAWTLYGRGLPGLSATLFSALPPLVTLSAADTLSAALCVALHGRENVCSLAR